MNEMAITIRVPEGATEVLVRLPAIIPTPDVDVDFRQTSGDVWVPESFFPGSVKRVIQ